MNASEDGLEVLYERLELASLTQRKTRGVALLSVQLHREGELEGAPPRATALEGDVLARLRRCVRRIDTVALVGPLRFLILLERAEAGPFAVHVADRIVTSLRRPFQGREGEPLVASVGISILGDDSVEVDEVMRYADAALNAARMGGGSLFGFYSGSMNEAASRRVAIERALVEAFDRNEFELHYQPQLDIQDGTVVGAEALLR
ncbi:MAG: diguanylate cyclase [Myxococcota bacterium]